MAEAIIGLSFGLALSIAAVYHKTLMVRVGLLLGLALIHTLLFTPR